MKRLKPPRGPVVILSADEGSRLLRFDDSKARVSAADSAEIPPSLEALQAFLTQGLFAAGWIGYEAGVMLANGRPIDRTDSSVPLLWFGIFSAPTTLDRGNIACANRAYVGPLVYEWNKEDYGDRFRQVQAHIADGDIYQANLSFRSRFRFVG